MYNRALRNTWNVFKMTSLKGVQGRWIWGEFQWPRSPFLPPYVLSVKRWVCVSLGNPTSLQGFRDHSSPWCTFARKQAACLLCSAACKLSSRSRQPWLILWPLGPCVDLLALCFSSFPGLPFSLLVCTFLPEKNDNSLSKVSLVGRQD